MTEALLAPPQTIAVSRPTLGAARGTLVLAVIHAALAAVAYLVLANTFGFPGILREPGNAVLEAFNQSPGVIRTAYYGFTVSSILLVPIAMLMRRGLVWSAPALVDVATAFGVLAGFAQILGFARWPLYVPYLASSYAAAEPGSARQDGIVLLYEAANRYSGMTVGEHIGWLCQGLWVVLLGIAITRQRPSAPWLGWLGATLGLLLLLSAGEQFQAGFAEPLGVLNAVATTAVPLWLIALAFWLTRRDHTAMDATVTSTSR